MSGLQTGETTGATILDVAALAKVSIRTVSRVINRSKFVNAETRSRVEAAVEELGFRPSLRARGLATGRSYLIGLVHDERNALVLHSVQRGIAAEASRRGCELVVHPVPAGQEPSVDDVLAFLARSHVDGIVIPPTLSGLRGLAEALAEVKAHVVAMSSAHIDGYEAMVLSNEREAVGQAARYLIELGHRQLALIAGPAGFHSTRERRAGFVDAVQGAGAELVGEVAGDYGFESGVAGASRLLDSLPRPTAIFASNDIMAAGVLKAAAARNIAVPGELSVVGFDGSPLADMVIPALTTLQRPMESMAQDAARCLLDMIEGVPTPMRMHATVTLRVGESTGPSPALPRP
ncbi:LacI family DNA-binding transcriptional regulator [Roseateles sp. LKC17W]|uniref:LacI family DNA-binding transcriptional regulator n=1 Tax=Pelomonas margarita TaxID=3299031 RepID=A0ABW7FPL5_9BURK